MTCGLYTALIVHVTITVALPLHSRYNNGQCPLKVPKELSTKVPIELSATRRPGLTTIAHRGSSFSLPEHSIPAYRLALELGADYIEPDLVSTKDGKLVAVHNIDLNSTTNVAQLFPERGRQIESKGVVQSGYFVFDFTFEEVQSLTVKQRLDGRSDSFDGLFSIPSLSDIVDLLYEWNTVIHQRQNSNRKPGIYVELKSPEIFLEQNISLVDSFINEMTAHPHSNDLFFNTNNETDYGCNKKHSYQVPPLVVQCFHSQTLKDVRRELGKRSMAMPPFVLLVDKNECHHEGFWFGAASMSFLSGIGPDKECLKGAAGKSFMIESKKFDLAVHAWTTREDAVQQLIHGENAEEELRFLYCKVGINGIFTENVDLGVKVGVRGCDDFLTAEEVLKEDIQDLEEQGTADINGTVSKEICREIENSSNNLVSIITSGLTGLTVGVLIMLSSRKKMWKGMMAIPTSTNDPGMEII